MDEELRRSEELAAHGGPQSLPTSDLLQQITTDIRSLAQLEIELAKAEAKVDLSSEVDLAKGITVAAVCGILGLNMLIIAAVFALAPEYAWMVALALGVVLLVVGAVAAFWGWQRAEKQPLGITRRTLKEDVEWARGQLK